MQWPACIAREVVKTDHSVPYSPVTGIKKYNLHRSCNLGMSAKLPAHHTRDCVLVHVPDCHVQKGITKGMKFGVCWQACLLSLA